MSASITSNLTLKQILTPVSEDIAQIDGVLRSIANIEYPLLQQGMEAIIAAGGKRLRPAILFLVAKFNRYDMERLLPMAAAIELLHTATLVHDDTIDRALLRRGLPTLNRSEEHTSELQSRLHLVCRLLLEKKKQST